MSKKKFGANHAKAMAYQGLAELGNALTADSNVTQRHLEHGIYGVGDPPTRDDRDDTPILDAYIDQASRESRSTRERASREARPPEPPAPERE
ncbi:MAG: hypothetical protein AB7K52_07015 [Phycisphaerales bacterium]